MSLSKSWIAIHSQEAEQIRKIAARVCEDFNPTFMGIADKDGEDASRDAYRLIVAAKILERCKKQFKLAPADTKQ